ncbi:MAG: succinate dehydrogenase cytochrome b subunit [Caldilineaceae bacterium]
MVGALVRTGVVDAQFHSVTFRDGSIGKRIQSPNPPIAQSLLFSLFFLSTYSEEAPLQAQRVLPTGLLGLATSTIGKKVIMAVTGLVWIGFVTFHMYGNLKVFGGAEYFNHYAEGLRELGSPVFGHTHLLWVLRIVIVVSIVLHVWAAVSLYQRALKARPRSYEMQRTVQANYASITIRYGGLVIFLFVLFHLMDLTWGTPVVHNGFVAGDPYTNVLNTFQRIPVVIVYLLALVALAFHLFHGTWSMFQTLGLNNRKYDRALRGLALALALIVPIGFAIVPLSVVFGLVS